MSIIRVKKDARYFAASNEPFNDTRLSWEARGIMGYLLSKPNDWQVRINDLEKQGPAGSRKIKRSLAELRLYGYMNRIRVKLENGKFDWLTEVYESPSQNPNPSKEVIVTSDTKCTSALPTSAKRSDLTSTEEISTEKPSVDLPKHHGKDLVDGMLDLAKAPGMKKETRIDSILSYVAGKLRINTETKKWREFAKYADNRNQTYGEAVDVFLNWLTGRKNFDVAYWSPQKMIEMWPQAFSVTSSDDKIRLL